MKAKFLKRHTGHNVGDVDDVEDRRARYLIRLKVIEPAEHETPQATEKKLTKKLKSAKKKK